MRGEIKEFTSTLNKSSARLKEKDETLNKMRYSFKKDVKSKVSILPKFKS